MSYPEHLSAFDYLGAQRYFLTFCIDGRAQHCTDHENVGLVREHFVRTSEREHFAVPAYCFMPDHVHFLVDDMDSSERSERKKQPSM